MNPSKLDLLKQQLSLPPSQSKKWRMSIIGLIGLGSMYFTSVGVMICNPEIAPHVQGLVSTITLAWGAIVGVFVGAQGVVDARTVTGITSTPEQPTT